LCLQRRGLWVKPTLWMGVILAFSVVILVIMESLVIPQPYIYIFDHCKLWWEAYIESRFASRMEPFFHTVLLSIDPQWSSTPQCQSMVIVSL
jgi:hypothetical protein